MIFKYHSWYLEIVPNFIHLTACEITYNNFEISLVVFMPNITTNHAITYISQLNHATLWMLRKLSFVNYREFKRERFWATRVNRKWAFFCFNIPWRYQISVAKCLYSSRDDLSKHLFKITAEECKKSTSGRRTSLENAAAVVWVLFSLFSIFCITWSGDCSHPRR